ncbi:M28 family metallopeptidase [Sphingobium nicotianae]|uniref:M28 family peptidase n=1 Tax=Sphingobium nicotianae TaxID=2782607 RepID=A0A9X1IQK0_9SPHN|nr:M28 family metallopeptidase [Sphingobium nicotianae]MBT2186762.1 M28 family peptidase [Sphingobium nicotianae]
MTRTTLRRCALAALALAQPAFAGPPEPSQAKIDAWWGHVEAISNDGNEGRLNGSPGYFRAADYVIAQLRKIGVKPAGTDGYLQPMDFVEQRFDQKASSATLKLPTGDVPFAVPSELFYRGSTAMPPTIEAPLVFAGYGLSIPEAGHDDFAGLDVKGKIVVVLSGGPASISGALKSDARADRAKLLAERGALGIISLTTPKQVEIVWERQVSNSYQSSMYLADPAMREVSTPFLSATLSPARAEALFAGSGHTFAEVAALSDASQPVPVFPLIGRFAARITTQTKPVHGANVIGLIPGSDRKLKGEYVVLSAHLDGLGVGEPIKGDTIYNGTFDNAIGVASVLEAAKVLVKGKHPRRSVILAIVTAEEKGLLGSRYFARRPTVPAGSIVADVNLDMPLPIFALTSVSPLGFEESSLGADAKAVAESMGLGVLPDPLPDRNAFTRSDQYSFIRQGIPALFPKYGFTRGTPEEITERAWRANIYHSPQDQLDQPVLKAEGVRMADYVTALVRHIADNPVRPSWNESSYFKRFTK